MRNSRKKGLLFFFLTVLVGFLIGLMTRSGQQSIDIFTDQFRVKMNWLDYKMGRPLMGTPDLKNRDKRLESKNLKMGAPIFLRIFKLEGELELWMKGENGFILFAIYPICRWSGGLGPKLKEGDRQSPEGFYTVSRGQLNPNSKWFRSFNLGYPNTFDKAHKRTGSFLMVHGGCSSIGCYAMTNPVMKEIWEIVTAALNKGQKRFATHVFPFRMTRRNMHVYSDKKWFRFWKSIRQGYELFEKTHVPPQVAVCKKDYQFQEGKLIASGEAPLVINSCKSMNISKH